MGPAKQQLFQMRNLGTQIREEVSSLASTPIAMVAKSEKKPSAAALETSHGGHCPNPVQPLHTIGEGMGNRRRPTRNNEVDRFSVSAFMPHAPSRLFDSNKFSLLPTPPAPSRHLASCKDLIGLLMCGPTSCSACVWPSSPACLARVLSSASCGHSRAITKPPGTS
jgi:hypothetical protein